MTTMITRSLRLQHVRVALPRHPPLRTLRTLRRYYASEVEQRYSEISPLAPRQQPEYDDQVKSDWDFFQHQKTVTDGLGSVVASHYRPRELLTNPPRPQDITLELLMASQSHLGHATSLWHPANAKYIFGVRGQHDPIHIISLHVTAAHLRRACKIVRGVTERGGLVLFVGSREGQSRCVVNAAQMAKGCHLFTKWIPGSITNGQQILGKCRKRVVNEYDQEVEGFEDQLIQKAAVKPDLVVCLNPLENYVLLHECGLNNIPTIGIVDTDVNPTWVTYPIPANDDSLRCVQVIAGVLGRAGEQGQETRLRMAEKGMIYRQDHGLEPPTEHNEVVRQRKEKEQSLLESAEAFDVTTLEDEQLDEVPGTGGAPAFTFGGAKQGAKGGMYGGEQEIGDVLEMVREAGQGPEDLQATSTHPETESTGRGRFR